MSREGEIFFKTLYLQLEKSGPAKAFLVLIFFTPLAEQIATGEIRYLPSLAATLFVLTMGLLLVATAKATVAATRAERRGVKYVMVAWGWGRVSIWPLTTDKNAAKEFLKQAYGNGLVYFALLATLLLVLDEINKAPDTWWKAVLGLLALGWILYTAAHACAYLSISQEKLEGACGLLAKIAMNKDAKFFKHSIQQPLNKDQHIHTKDLDR